MKHRWIFAAAFLLLCGCAAKQQEPPSQTATTAAPWRLNAAPVNAAPGAVAARVNGQVISAAHVQWRTGSTAQDPAHALNDAIDDALLVQEAVRRGLHRRPAALRTARRALANRLVRRRFVEDYKKANIPQASIERAYDLNRMRFDRPELVKVSHILVAAGKKASPETKQTARIAAKQVWKLATAEKHTAETFRALRKRVKADYPRLRLTAESLVTPRHGLVVEPFGAAAFKLKNKGDVSPVVETDYGYHVIYLEDRKQAIHRSIDEADEEIRDLIYDDVRREAVDNLLARLKEESAIARYPDNLTTPDEGD